MNDKSKTIDEICNSLIDLEDEAFIEKVKKALELFMKAFHI